MKTTLLRDQRGVAMLMELVLVALVLAMVGIALYQSNNHKPTDVGANIKPAVATAGNVAEIAAAATLKAADVDTALGNTAESTVDQFDAINSDITNLEGSFDENNF